MSTLKLLCLIVSLFATSKTNGFSSSDQKTTTILRKSYRESLKGVREKNICLLLSSNPTLSDYDGESSVKRKFVLKKRNPYDVHVYFKDETELDEAMILREKMMGQFPWMRFYNPKNRAIGPHPIPMWEADFGGYENRDQVENVFAFLEEEHGNLSVLVHPHSQDGDYADHTCNAQWFGEVLELRIQGWRR